MSEAASYKAGDRVVCTSNFWPFKEGRTYEVIGHVLSEILILNGWQEYERVSVTDEMWCPEARVRHFAVGDEVRLRSHAIAGPAQCVAFQAVPIGSVGEVTDRIDHEGDVGVSFDGELYFVHCSNLELASELADEIRGDDRRPSELPGAEEAHDTEAPPAAEEPNDETFVQLGEIASIFIAKLGPNGREVLFEVAKRLEKGAVQYGDFDTERDWNREILEEDLDGIVYRTVREIARGRR